MYIIYHIHRYGTCLFIPQVLYVVTIFISAVNAGKAFDRIDHDVLFQKIIHRGVLLKFSLIGITHWYLAVEGMILAQYLRLTVAYVGVVFYCQYCSTFMWMN